MKAFAPDGMPIKGTFEILAGLCRDAHGQIAYRGHEAFVEKGLSISIEEERDETKRFMDSAGRLWSAGQVILFEGNELPQEPRSEKEQPFVVSARAELAELAPARKATHGDWP